MSNENTVSSFDRQVGQLKGLPDAVHTKPSTIKVVQPLTGISQTWVISTVRQREVGDTVFLERGDAEGYFRIFLPPAVTAVLRRQDAALTDKMRTKGAKEAAKTRKDRGVVPFQRKKKAVSE